jgi:hypothetical protein
MAGRKQHDLPQLLLKGFVSKTKGDKKFLWQFRKDAAPIEASLRDVGHSKCFYGEPGPGTLDEAITEWEAKVASCIDQIRSQRTIASSIDETILVEFVHSLVMRTRNLSDTIGTAVSSMLNELHSVATDHEKAQRQLLKEQARNTPMWDAALTNYVKEKYGPLNRQQEKYVKKVENKSFKRWLKRGAEKHIQEVTERNKEQLTPVLGQVEDIWKGVRNDALKAFFPLSSEVSTPRLARYRQLKWHIHSLESNSLILGDVAVLQYECETGKFSPGFDKDRGDFILLPMNHDLLVVGSTEKGGTPPAVNEINQASAKLSFHYFVACKNSEQEREHQSLLGRDVICAQRIFTP